MSRPTYAVIGAGSRGAGYADFIRNHPEIGTVTAVADPREHYRRNLAQQFAMAEENVFADWRELLDRPRLADAVIIATPDSLHTGPAIAAAQKGYHILLEKPMAPTDDECRRIIAAVQAAGKLFAVCHVLRYTDYTTRFRELVQGGAIGDLVSLQHLEPVGFWHQAHSFVRGNWRNESESSFMLLAKSCHDLDWIRFLIDSPCRRVSSFGNLYHFRPENRPPNAADRCLDCPVEPSCPYSAKRSYLGLIERGSTGWPVNVLTPDPTVESVTQALREGPYGRCVYACDNDVVDHQVVNLEFAGGQTAVFTMTAFHPGGHRQTRAFGTRGYIEGDGETLKHFDFLTCRWQTVDTRSGDASITGGHGGGDFRLMQRFTAAVAAAVAGEPLEAAARGILSGPDETLETHLTVFAAERARRQGTVETVSRR